MAYSMEQEFRHLKYEHCDHSRPSITPNANVVNSLFPDLQYDKRGRYHGLCFDEGAPHPVTRANQWMACLRAYHVPTTMKTIQSYNPSIFFGGKAKIRVKTQSIGIVIIRVPLPAICNFHYNSFLIPNDASMLLGINSQTMLSAVTEKDPINPTATFKAIGVTL